jgi:hypothetical protein
MKGLKQGDKIAVVLGVVFIALMAYKKYSKKED